MSELIHITKPDGKRLRIMNDISSHPLHKCSQFAEVLLKNHLLVQKLGRDNKSEEAFIKAVLDEWLSSVEGPAVPCTWLNLIECMKKVDMNGVFIQDIEDVLMLPTGKVTECQ